MECPFLYLMKATKNSSRGGTRTPDPVINSHLLYHLSYSGIAMKISQHEASNQLTAAREIRHFCRQVILPQGMSL